MAFTAISSILTAGLLKIGYKVAENKKWLPKGIYHRLSLKKIKEGDLKQAIYFNSVAIKKHPEYENALIVRDIISMQQDAQTDQIKKLLTAEEDKIHALKKLKHDNEKKIKNKHSLNKISKILGIFFVVAVICCLYFGIFYLKNVEIKYTVWLVVLIVLCMVFYIAFNRIFGDFKKIKETISWQERIATIDTYNREIKVRVKRVRVLKNELKDILNI